MNQEVSTLNLSWGIHHSILGTKTIFSEHLYFLTYSYVLKLSN